MSFWDVIMGHADALSLGSDALMVVSAIKGNDGTMFAASFGSLVKDMAHVGKIKEITPELIDKLEPHIKEMATILMAHANS